MKAKYLVICAIAIAGLVFLSGCVQEINFAASCETNCQDMFSQKKSACMASCGMSGKSDVTCQTECDSAMVATIEGCKEDCRKRKAFESGDVSYCTTLTELNEYNECFFNIAVKEERPNLCKEMVDGKGDLERNLARECLARIAKKDPKRFGPGGIETNLCTDDLFFYELNNVDGLPGGKARAEKFTCETEANGAKQSGINCTSIIAIMLVAVSAYACRRN
ncbi:Uncharacterised protein [Candidatus Gugararchaeum adminiculabundum]|nr:Uncharacterised protein [Candidatus Gugararchaeum adminiculabundum]